jgi:Spy/CpxP family protein refolding chaperone
MHILATAAVFAVPALIATATVAHGHPQDFHAMIAKRLELTEGQQAAIHKVMVGHQMTFHAKGRALVEARGAVLHLLVNPEATESQIRDLEAQASAADLAMELEVNQMVKEINPILTDAQRLKAHELLGEFHAHAKAFMAQIHGGAAISIHPH